MLRSLQYASFQNVSSYYEAPRSDASSAATVAAASDTAVMCGWAAIGEGRGGSDEDDDDDPNANLLKGRWAFSSWNDSRGRQSL